MKLYLRGKTWWVTYGGSSRRRVSTHRSDKREAEEYALRLIAPAMMERDADMLEKAVKLRKTASKTRAGMLLLDSIFKQDAYCSLHGCKESSAAVAGRYWRRFVDFCKSREVVEAGELTQSLCAEFISGLGERAAQLARIYCRQILRDAGYDAELFPRIRRRSDVTHREPLSREQISTLLAMADTRGMEFATHLRPALYRAEDGGLCDAVSRYVRPAKGDNIKDYDKDRTAGRVPAAPSPEGVVRLTSGRIYLPFLGRWIHQKARCPDSAHPALVRIRRHKGGAGAVLRTLPEDDIRLPLCRTRHPNGGHPVMAGAYVADGHKNLRPHRGHEAEARGAGKIPDSWMTTSGTSPPPAAQPRRLWRGVLDSRCL